MNYIFILLISLFPLQVFAEGKVIHIYQDADLSNHVESSEAIQKGIEVAFDEAGNEVAGYKVEFKYLNHRGNVIRSKQNYEKFLEDPKALAIYSGIHSPPLIKNRTHINENKALTLVPWAAGGPITRHPSAENWIFRLSVDDTRAGPVLIDFAMEEQGCKSPHLLLEETPWGDSNLKSMSKKLTDHGIKTPEVARFGWNLSNAGARTLLRKIIEAGSDCVVLVGNAIEGAVIIQEVANVSSEKKLPVISHWGITGGDFHKQITAEKRKNLDLHFIQSCFAFTNEKQSDHAKEVFERLKRHSGGAIEDTKDLKSAVGFIHAYDLTKLLIQAIKQSELTGDIKKDRNIIRLALENIEKPIQGLVKTYNKPFSVFDEKTNPNAHEALNAEDYCMGKYGPSDEIVILN